MKKNLTIQEELAILNKCIAGCIYLMDTVKDLNLSKINFEKRLDALFRERNVLQDKLKPILVKKTV